MSGNPFIPKQIANTVIVDGRVSLEIIKNLKNLKLNVIPTIKCKELPEPISYHPDIVLHPINRDTVVAAPNVFDYYKLKLSKLGIKVIKGKTELGEDYSNHIAYNVGRIGNFAIHNLKYTDEKLKYYFRKQNLELIHVNQGYTKCSMAIINKNAIITSDIPICEKFLELGVNVLLVEPGYIELKGYPYGFIGGTSGSLSDEIIVFSGKFKNHPDKKEIFKFLKEHSKKTIWLSGKKIIDIGTILSLETY